nr:hypothetical protein Itr_chr05CG20540 [Ipomoea trifida]
MNVQTKYKFTRKARKQNLLISTISSSYMNVKSTFDSLIIFLLQLLRLQNCIRDFNCSRLYWVTITSNFRMGGGGH